MLWVSTSRNSIPCGKVEASFVLWSMEDRSGEKSVSSQGIAPIRSSSTMVSGYALPVIKQPAPMALENSVI